MKGNDLIHNLSEVSKDRKVIVFDLDGTLAESKSEIDGEMETLLTKLLKLKRVAVIGGGKYDLFRHQLLNRLSAPPELLKNLFIFPATATSFYRYNGSEWMPVYSQIFSKDEKISILSAFEKAFQELNYQHLEKIYGEIIEDRGAEIVFSALGQEAPIELKEKWRQDNLDTREKITEALQKYLPDMEVKVTGLTSIDITRKGIDKAYGMEQIKKYLETNYIDMLFVGDAFSAKGNDAAVLNTDVLSFEVKGVEDTKALVRYLLQ